MQTTDALLVSYVMEAEGEIDAAKREVDNAKSSKQALTQAMTEGDAKSILQEKIEAAQPELDRIMEEMDQLSEDDEAGQLALMEAYDSAYGKQAIYENALNALQSAEDAIAATTPAINSEAEGDAAASDDASEAPDAVDRIAATEAAAQAAIDALIEDAQAGVEAASAAAEEMRSFTPATFPEFDGKSYLKAGLSHWVGILLGLTTLLGLALLPARNFGGRTEQRWTVAGLALMTCVAGTGASQIAEVGPMLIGVPAMGSLFGMLAVGVGFVVFLAVLFLKKDAPFGWMDGLVLTGLLGAVALMNLLHVVDNVLAKTQVPMSQMLVICLPMIAIVLMWPLGQKGPQESAEHNA